MVEPCYKYTNKGTSTDIDNHTLQIFTFKSQIINQQYIIEVLYLKHHIYVIQFYLKAHRLSKNRFSLFIPKRKGKTGNNNTHVFLLLNTIVNISLELYKQNPKASLGFMGAPTLDELDHQENINPDNTIRKTKRYRVYSMYVKRYFPPNTFTHIEYENSSCYLLKNNLNTQLDKDTSDNYVNEVIATKHSNDA